MDVLLSRKVTNCVVWLVARFIRNGAVASLGNIYMCMCTQSVAEHHGAARWTLSNNTLCNEQASCPARKHNNHHPAVLRQPPHKTKLPYNQLLIFQRQSESVLSFSLFPFFFFSSSFFITFSLQWSILGTPHGRLRTGIWWDSYLISIFFICFVYLLSCNFVEGKVCGESERSFLI